MSIDVRLSNDAKVRKDLNLFFASGAPLIIKVLTDLENRVHTFFYRHVGPEGPKETMRGKKRFVQRQHDGQALRGTGPRATVLQHIPLLTVGRGPVPRMPRATVVRDRLSPNGAGEITSWLFRSIGPACL